MKAFEPPAVYVQIKICKWAQFGLFNQAFLLAFEPKWNSVADF